MILIDSSIWIDHLRKEEPAVSALLRVGQIYLHPFVLGEVALGNFKNRKKVLSDISRLPQVKVANDFEVLTTIERFKIYGSGLGYVDCHLLASALMSGKIIWSRDKRMVQVARQLGVSGEIG